MSAAQPTRVVQTALRSSCRPTPEDACRRCIRRQPRATGMRWNSTQRGSAAPRKPSAKRPSNEPQTLSHLFAQRKFAIVGFGLSAAVLGAYVTQLYLSVSRTPKKVYHAEQDGDMDASQPTGRTAELREGRITATAFDISLDRPENLMGIASLRKEMASVMRGHVLEVAVGTGRNVPYMDWSEIKALAPKPIGPDDDPNDQLVEVKASDELERERNQRRLQRDKDVNEMLSFTGVDVSPNVLEVTWSKLRKAVPELVPRRRKQRSQEAAANQTAATASAPAAVSQPDAANANSAKANGQSTLAVDLGKGRIRLFIADALEGLPVPAMLPGADHHEPVKAGGRHGTSQAASGYYDTVVQNFGICSVAEPSRLLANMAAVVKPETGRIYLLEHGRGWYDFINGILDRLALPHFEKYGCWWNKDIQQIVEQAQQEIPGLEIVKVERPLFTQAGTLLWIELRVNEQRGT